MKLLLRNRINEVEKYYKTVCFTFGLAATIFIGSLNALLMTPKSEWFVSLSGMYVNGKVHSVCWLVVYILTAIHIGEFFGRRELRKYIWVIAVVSLLGIVWCGVFFRLHSMTGAVAVLSVITAFIVFLFGITLKKTRLLALLTAPVLAWYGYLLFINVYLAALN